MGPAPCGGGLMTNDQAFRRALVPLDGSARSEQALPYAAQLAGAFGIPVRLLFAVEGWDHVAQVMARTDAGDFDPALHSRLLQSSEAALAAVREYLAAHAQRLGPGVAADTAVGMGDAAETIVTEAEQEAGTVVVMTTHGRGGFGRLVFGSTAEAVLRRSRAPVLLIRVA